MPLNTIKGFEQMLVEQIVVVLGGEPGVGKTSLAYTARGPLLLDFDGGAYRAMNRGDTVRVSSWADVAAITDADVADYDTIIIDTVGQCLMAITNQMSGNPKLVGPNGACTQQGWGQLKSTFVNYLNRLRSLGKDIVLITHSTEERQGDDTKIRMDVQGGSKAVIYQSSDLMGMVRIIGNDIVLDFNPSERSFGKNPAQLPPIKVKSAGPTCLADVISQTKAHFNALSAEQQEVSALQLAFQERVDAAKSAKALTELVGEVKNLDERIHDQATDMIKKARTERGLIWKGGKFVKKEDVANEGGGEEAA